MGYGDGIGEAFGCVGWFVLFMLLVIGFLGFKTCNKEIESDKPLTPEIRLIVNDNQIDTLYIYKK